MLLAQTVYKEFHCNCVNLCRDDMHSIQHWYCQLCMESALPFGNVSDDDDYRICISELAMDHPIQLMQLNSQVLTPFEINDSVDTPLFDIDPDYQFFTDLKYATNISCDYYVEHTFCRLIQNKWNLLNQLSLFQLNVRSLPRHYNELDLYFHSLQYDFEIIGLTETWLTENNSDLYGIHGYQSINKFRDNRAGGGVSLYVKNSVNFEHRNDLGIFDNELEMLSIELDKSY